jgi:flagellar protein FlgJ
MLDLKIDPRMMLSQAAPQPDTRKARDLESLRESSREFETLLVMEMFKAMRQAVPDGGLFEKSQATEMYQEMIDMETAREATRGKGLGIAEAMYNQMAHLIENRK